MIRLRDVRWPPVDRLELLLKAHRIPYEREFQFAPPRRWKADFVLPSIADPRVLVECEGLVWQGKGGRHQRAKGFAEDVRKYEAARALGLQVVRVIPEAIDSGECVAWILKALEKAQ